MKKILTGLLAGAALAGAANAQDAPARAPTTGLADIVVTAQRRAENLQQVPIAVTALTADNLAAQRVISANDLAGMVPSLQTGSQGMQSNPNIFIRGIAIGASNSGIDPKIGIYVDGVYIGRTVGALFDLPDAERMEVLRGPQGTLFGRNATAGAVNITTGAPTGEWGFRGSASFGNYSAKRFHGVVNFPALGRLSFRVAYLHDEMDGYGHNLIAGKTLDLRARAPEFGVLTAAEDLGKRNTNAVQAAAHLDLDNLQIDYRFDRTSTTANGFPMQSLGVISDATGALVGPIQQLQGLWGGNPNDSVPFLKDVANITSPEHVLAQGHSLTMTVNASDKLTLKSITAFRKFRQDPTVFDLAATGGFRFTTAQLYALLQGNIGFVVDPANYPAPDDDFSTLLTARSSSQTQFSQELQLQYATDAVQLTAGAFFFHENAPSADVLGILEPHPHGIIVSDPILESIFGSGMTRQRAINDSLAAYGELTWHVSDTIDLTGGARYTFDNRRSEIYEIAAAQGADLGVGTYQVGYEKLTFTGIVAWHPTPDFNTYAKVARGYVSGGILSGIPFRPETLTDYEVGLKAQLFDNRLRTNLAAYYMRYNDLQIQNFTDGVQFFSNAGKATVKGFEAEITAVPVRGLTLSGMASYTDFDYQEFILQGVDVASVARPAFFSPWQFSVSGRYDAPEFANGSHLFAAADASYRSSFYLVSMPLLDAAGDVDPIDSRQHVKGFTRVNGSIGLADIPLGSAKASLTIFAKNLLNKQDLNFGASVIRLVGTYDRGRTWGAELGIRF